MIEGRLDLVLGSEGGVRIRSSRPVAACRVFEGKPPSEVLPLVPMLFSLCGQSQAVAAARALEAALGRPARVEVERRRAVLIALEAVREHLLYFLGHAPPLLDLEAEVRSLPTLLAALAGLMRAVNPGAGLTKPPAKTPANTSGGAFPPHPGTDATRAWNALERRLRRQLLGRDGMVAALGGRLEALAWQGLCPRSRPSLPILDGETVGSRLEGTSGWAFVARPDLDGEIPETGPWARRQADFDVPDGSLGQRMRARAQDLRVAMEQVGRGLADAGEAPAASALGGHAPVAGTGLAQVESVRGRLLHRVILDDRGWVAEYRILAPTEWNFHPRGIAAALLDALPEGPPERCARQAHLLVRVLDPCVGYRFVVGDADA